MLPQAAPGGSAHVTSQVTSHVSSHVTSHITPHAKPHTTPHDFSHTSPHACPAAQPPAQPSAAHLHPDLWLAHQLGHSRRTTLPSGFTELDAQLPGGGWPAQALTELLLPHPGIGEMRLLAPVLAAIQQQQRCLMWFDPPAMPCAWALRAMGIDVNRLVMVRARQEVKGRARQLLPAADILWAVEQALKSGHVGAVPAWLPARLPADALRRLQLAAQGHDGPVFLLRHVQQQSRASPAPLRVLLACAGADRLQLTLLKRRGPPLLQPLVLQLPQVLPQQPDAHPVLSLSPFTEEDLS